MLNEFYDFIAKRINAYFQEAAEQGKLQIGESFCMKLDDNEMVYSVYQALKDLLLANQSMGKYVYLCKDGTKYETYTIRIANGKEVIIAAQINGMTNDFLCATIRNDANDKKKALLMISSNPIDSAKSGSRDMSAYGMPFYADNLIQEIRTMAFESSDLTELEKLVLDFEFERREADVFSDRSSLYEYRDLLAIMSKGRISDDNYQGFRLFPIDGKNDYQNMSKKQMQKELRDNNDLYERIDRAIRFGNLNSELSDYFEDMYIEKIEKARRKNPDTWTTSFKYMDLTSAMEKRQGKKENPLRIEHKDIEVYGELPFNSLNINENVFIRDEGSMTRKKRSRSMLIFNPNRYDVLHIRISCNCKLLQNDISKDDLEYIRDKDDLIFELKRKDITFHKITLRDSVNSIEYIFKICVMDILPAYITSAAKANFIVDYKPRKENSAIKLLGIGSDLVFNANGQNSISKQLKDNGTYYCAYDQRLHLFMQEEELANYGSGICVEINFSGIAIIFRLFPDESKSVEIIGRNILREKMKEQKSFTISEDFNIYKDSQEYYVKANLLRELTFEKQIIEEHIAYASCKPFYNNESPKLIKKPLAISSGLLDAYNQMLDTFGANDTLPTLAYLNDELKESVVNFVEVFKSEFINLRDNDNLSEQQANALLLGSIDVGKDIREIMLTPFHPLNLLYQITLMQEKDFEYVGDLIMERLSSVNLLPYIRRNHKNYQVSDRLYSMEWKYYAPVENKKYMGNRRFVPKLIEEKISEFVAHFKYIFDKINNKTVRINLINMGDCSDVFVGLAQYFIHAVKKNPDFDKLMRFEIHVYTDDVISNAFSNIREYTRLKEYLAKLKLAIDKGITMNSLEGIISKNVDCYFHKDEGSNYVYAHLSFYEMESEITSEYAEMNSIETGISLDGIISGIPSSKYGTKYRTGFGTKYATDSTLIKFSSNLNALVQVGDSGNPFNASVSISTQIDSSAEAKMDEIYDSSNWVVFVEPKVDLDFFYEKESNSDLLIIHYSDQYTTSSGYDAITVTHKANQYSRVIGEYLQSKGIDSNDDDIAKIINLFNAVNGDWLLRLVSSKKMIGANKDTTFSREKISIVAAIKFMLAFLKHPDIVWVPVSLEEMLRVSGGAGLSQTQGVLSVKSLGFEKGPTSDDLMFVGLYHADDQLKIYLYPTEVKTGNNENLVITKAFKQVSSTADGFDKAFNVAEQDRLSLAHKVNRNFLMQVVITSCKKMKVYHVDDSQNWDAVLDLYRMRLLNEDYEISTDICEILGKGAVLSFRKNLSVRKTSFREGVINFIEMPELDEFDLILKSVSEIHCDIHLRCDLDFLIFYEKQIDNLTGLLPTVAVEQLQDYCVNDDEDSYVQKVDELKNNVSNEFEEVEENFGVEQEIAVSHENANSRYDEVDSLEEKGMHILFGTNQLNGKPVIWEPNNTDLVFHTNTGIIGTMGTGKTQFTQSLIAQLYQNREENIHSSDIGILIFDYKGDYNDDKEDFKRLTNSTVLKPYHLPFNPLALSWSGTPKPLLPVHTANTFVDTISRAFPNIGAKQKGILLDCINTAYSNCGINKAISSTWTNEVPTFEQVYQVYNMDEDIKKGDVLETALHKISMFEIFEPIASNTKPLYEILKGVVVIDLSGYDTELQNLVVAMTLDQFYSQMQAAGHSKLEENARQLSKIILVDEADNFLRGGYSSLRKILKEGREFGVGTILSTQFLKHFETKDEDYSKYILTWIVHNVADLSNSDVRFVFNTIAGSNQETKLCSDIKNLAKHESIIKIGNNENPIHMKDKPFWQYVHEYDDNKN